MLEIARRRDLHDFVGEVVSHTYERLLAGERFDVGQSMLKSYVVEQHPFRDGQQDQGTRRELLVESTRALDPTAEVAATEDGRLFLVDFRQAANAEPVSFVVDMQDDRYWQFHSAAKAEEADAFMTRLVGDTPFLDAAWLPGRYLHEFSATGSLYKIQVGFDDGTLLNPVPRGRHQAFLVHTEDNRLVLSDAASDEQPVRDLEEPGTGGSSLSLALRDWVGLRGGLQELQETNYLSHQLNITRAEFRYHWNGMADEFSNERLYSWGKVTASGTSGDAHLDLMNRLVRDYRERIERLELQLGCRPHEAPAVRLHGQPASIEYRQVENFEPFVLNLFSGTKPFRLTGTPQFRRRKYAVVSAFDLHARQPLRFEIAADYMTVSVPAGGCGNTIARLYTNLLEHLDAEAVMYCGSRHEPLF